MTSLFHNQNQLQQTPQSSSPNLLQTLTTTTTITESVFGSAWNNTWLPHPTRDVTSSLYPWTEDACRDFLLQTALSMCCGARPSPSACSFSLAQLTPISQQSPDSASLMSSVGVGGALNFSPMSETPSARQRKNEERLLRVFFVDLFEAKKRQFEDQNQNQQQQDESKKVGENDKEATEKMPQNSEEKEEEIETKKKKKQLPPKMTPKELCQAFLPSAFWMQSDALHPFAISCAWRIAFNVQPAEDILLQAQDEIRREVFSPEEYDYAHEENEDEKNEENVSAASKNEDAAEDNNKNTSSSSEIWTNLYDSAIEDRSLAATHIRGIISRKLTLDRFSVRELCFIWHLVSGPRSTAMKWFRKYLKNLNETASSNVLDNVTTPASSSKTPANNNNNNNNVASSVVSSSASTTTTAAAGSPLSPSLQKQTITLQQTGLYPKNINLVFAPLVLNCIVKKDSLMFEMRALYFGVLEQHNIGKERRVIPNPNASENTQQKEDDNDADQKSKTTAEEQTSSKTTIKPKKKQVTIETPSQQLRKQAPARRTRETTEEDDEENNRNDEEQNNNKKKTSSSKEEKEQKSSTKTGNSKKGTAASSSSSSQQQQQQQPSFGFLFGNTPINPYYDRNEEMKLKQQKSLQQRGYRLIVYDSDTNTSTNTSLMADQGFTSSSNSNLLNNNSLLMVSNENNNTSTGVSSSRRRNVGNAFSSHDDHHHQQKPEIELSTADEVVTNENSNNNNNNKTASSSSANATTLISAPVVNKNSSSVSSTSLPRHSSSAWQLLSVVNLQKQKQHQQLQQNEESTTATNKNLPPVIWQEYYQRCAELMKNEGLMNRTSNIDYFEKKF